MKTTVIAALVGAMMISGCVSIDGTRAKLNSKDASEVQKAEETIYAIATTGKDPSGLIEFSIPEQIEYVNLTSNNELLLRIIDNARQEVIIAATERLDFSKKGMTKEFVKTRFEQLDGVDGKNKQVKQIKRIVEKLNENELLDLVSDKKLNDNSHREILIERLIEITNSPNVLWLIIETEGKRYARSDCRDNAEKRLLTMLDKIEDPSLAEKILEKDNLVRKPADRIVLLKKLPEAKTVELVLADIKEQRNAGYWIEWTPLETGIGMAAFIKDRKSVVRIVAEVLEIVKRYDGHKDKINSIISNIPELAETEIVALICLDNANWGYLNNRVSAEGVYKILTLGKAKSAEFEEMLVKKLPPERIDMKVYNSVKTDAGRKAAFASMPAELKKDVQESQEKAFEALLAKAKEAAKSTFELDGFYLGMTMDDAKTVFLHHFPDGSVKVSKDGCALYVSGQRDPLCRAQEGAREVYQFNFGKAMLKKWYKYNAATIAAWAEAYAKEQGINMELEFLEKEGKVYVPTAMFEVEPYSVSLDQETYQSKNAMKDYRLTYFGEPRIRAYGGGVVAEELAESKYAAISADAGTLRAEIEK